MALSKLAIISLVALGTVGTIGAVTASVVVSQQTTEPNKDQLPSNPEIPAQENNSNAQTELSEVIKTISQNDIVLIKKQASNEAIIKKNLSSEQTKEVKLEDIYAFDANAYDFALSKKKQLPANITVEIKSKEESFKNLNDLNGGKLDLELIVKDKVSNKEEKTNLNVSIFKKPDSKILELFGENSNNQKDYVLPVIVGKNNKVEKFSTLEYLNKERLKLAEEQEPKDETFNGISVLLNEVNKQGDKKETNKNITLAITGKIKLLEIKKESDDKTYFYLGSVDESFLKLKRTENKEVSEVLVKQIKLNNLAISSLSVVPLENKEEVSETYRKELLTKWKEGTNEADTLSVTINKTKARTIANDQSVNLPISAYKLEKDSKDPINLEANLVVSFGSGDFVKTYNTTEANDLNELKNAGFSFGIFSKQLVNKKETQKPEVCDSSIVEMTNKLDQYFTNTSNKNPTNKPEIKEDDMKQDGEYFLNRLANSSLEAKFKLGENSPKVENREKAAASVISAEKMNQNWLVFANYSYPNMDESNKKVLYAPTLSLIHLEIKKATE